MPKHFCFADANGNPVKVPLYEKPKPLSEEEEKEFSDAVHKAVQLLECRLLGCRDRRYTKEELEELARFILNPPEFKPEEGETTNERS